VQLSPFGQQLPNFIPAVIAITVVVMTIHCAVQILYVSSSMAADFDEPGAFLLVLSPNC
jgi:hypothetical protein